MELLWIVVAILVIVVATYFRQRESMTNADVRSALQKYGGPDPPKKDKSDVVSKTPIYGPKVDEPVPTTKNDSKDPKSKKTTPTQSVYPDIYGPDVELVPGTKPQNPKHVSDDTSGPTYEFNPDLQKAFPTSGPPEPYLTDFSKFQK